MLTPNYLRLLARLLRRRLFTRRLHSDGIAFIGPAVTLQIGRRGRIELGRWSWLGHGTKLRCHEGVISIGAKTVLGQECTISAYQRVEIGRECVIADRVMLIDFDHGATEVERPVRLQGIYKRDVRVGHNVWIGYGACILRGVTVGDNAIVGTNAVVTRDVPANAVVAGVPARVVRMREEPQAAAVGVSEREAGVLARGPWEAHRVSARWSERPFDAGAGAEAQADAAIAEPARARVAHPRRAGRPAGVVLCDGTGLDLELEPARWAHPPRRRRAGQHLRPVRGTRPRGALAGGPPRGVGGHLGRAVGAGAGGAVDLGENPADTLARELEEEWSVQADHMSVEALVRLPTGLILLVGMAHLPAGAEVTIDPEHDAHAWWPPDPRTGLPRPIRRCG